MVAPVHVGAGQAGRADAVGAGAAQLVMHQCDEGLITTQVPGSMVAGN
jgi:hypothetical protein